MDTLVHTVLIVGVVIRIVLDLSSLFSRTGVLDFCYGALFGMIAIVLFVSEGPSIWAFGCAAVAAYSFIIALLKPRNQAKQSGRQ